MIEIEIKKIKNEIENSAKRIKFYNPDNILEFDIDEYETTKVAKELIVMNDISLYYSPYLDLHDIPYLTDILESKTETEFYSNLHKYCDGMKDWVYDEENAFIDNILPGWVDGNLDDINSNEGEYIVKVNLIYPAWADGQLNEIIICNNQKEADLIANDIDDNMNIRAEVVKITSNTKDDIINEYINDILRLANNNHHANNLKISSSYYYNYDCEDCDDN